MLSKTNLIWNQLNAGAVWTSAAIPQDFDQAKQCLEENDRFQENILN